MAWGLGHHSSAWEQAWGRGLTKEVLQQHWIALLYEAKNNKFFKQRGQGPVRGWHRASPREGRDMEKEMSGVLSQA